MDDTDCGFSAENAGDSDFGFTMEVRLEQTAAGTV
jgi:hypothetical protein